MSGKGPISPHGLQVIASTRDAEADRKNLPKATSECTVTTTSRWRNQTYQCGHSGPRWFKVSTYGIETNRIRNKERCPTCWIEWFKEFTARCALCGLPIVPGDGVALYNTESEGLRLDIASRVGENSVVGCMRWHCAPSGGFFAGHWTEDGFVSAFEGRTASESVFEK